MEIIARFITIIAITLGFFMGAIAGHFEGQASVYARMVGQTADMLAMQGNARGVK